MARDSSILTFALAFGFLAVPVAAETGAPVVTAYPADVAGVDRSELGRALGKAAYVLADVQQPEAFRRTVALAVARHPARLAARASVVESEARVAGARSGLYPRITAGVSGDYVIDREFGAQTDNVVQSLQPAGQANARLTVDQLLFDGGATSARIASARAAARAEAHVELDAAARLTLQALGAYHDLVAWEAIAALGEEFIARHETLVADLRERERRGAGVQADVRRAEARLASAGARVVQIRESAAIAEVRYREFFDDPTSELRWPKLEALAASTAQEALSLAISRNPAKAAAEARAAEARAGFDAAKASRLPSVRASVDAAKFDLFETGDYDVRAGVDLSYELFAGGSRRAAIAAASAFAERSVYEEDRVGRELVRDVSTSFARKEAAEQRLVALQSALIAHHDARELVAKRFRAARGDLLDILQAENEWFEAAVAYLIAATTRDMTAYELMSFTGGLARLFDLEAAYQSSGERNDG